MNAKPLREHLKQHYGGMSLSEESLARLAAATATEPTLDAGRPSRRLFRLSQWGMAAAITLLVTGLVWQQRTIRSLEQRLAVAQTQAVRTVADAPVPEAIGQQGFPRLVAVRTVADGCPRCPIIEPVYDQLAERYGNEAVLFVTLDVSDENTYRQACMLVSSLGLDCIAGDPLQSGVIRLIDRWQGNVLATCYNEDQKPQIESAIQLALGSRGP